MAMLGKLFAIGVGFVTIGLFLGRRSRGATTKKGGGGDGSGQTETTAWLLFPPDVMPGAAFYSPPSPGGVSQLTGEPIPALTPPPKRRSLVNGTNVTLVLAGKPNWKSEGRPPLVQVNARVVANYTGEHAPHDFQSLDPTGWYYDVVVTKVRNANSDVDLADLPRVGLPIDGVPAMLVGSVG